MIDHIFWLVSMLLRILTKWFIRALFLMELSFNVLFSSSLSYLKVWRTGLNLVYWCLISSYVTCWIWGNDFPNGFLVLLFFSYTWRSFFQVFSSAYVLWNMISCTIFINKSILFLYLVISGLKLYQGRNRNGRGC